MISPIAVTGLGNASGGTTPDIDTTGADALFVFVADYIGQDRAVITDSNGNDWEVVEQVDDGYAVLTLYRAVSPAIVGAGHNVIVDSTNSYVNVHFSAFSGVSTGPKDQSSIDFTSGYSGQPGEITPIEDGELILTATVQADPAPTVLDSGFTVYGDNYFYVPYFGVSAGYLVQETAAPVNPTWTGDPFGTSNESMQVSFKAAGGGGSSFTRIGTFTLPTLPATRAGFPVPVNITHDDFKQLGDGGYVEDPNADDVRWFADEDLTDSLPSFKKYYDATAGQWVGWVTPPTISSGQNIYAGIGNAALNTDISDASETFDSGFERVIIYFDAGGGALGAKDLITGDIGTVTGATLVTGANGPAASFNGSGQSIDFGNAHPVTSGEILVTAVVKPNTLSRCDAVSVWSAGTLPASQFDLTWGIVSAKPDFYFVGPSGIKHTGANNTISTGVWHTLHGQCDGTHVRQFINGAFNSADAGGAPGEGPQTSPTDAFRLGENNAGDGDTNADIDVVYVHNTARLDGGDYSSWLEIEDLALRDPGSFLTYSSAPFVSENGAAAILGRFLLAGLCNV